MACGVGHDPLGSRLHTSCCACHHILGEKFRLFVAVLILKKECCLIATLKCVQSWSLQLCSVWYWDVIHEWG